MHRTRVVVSSSDFFTTRTAKNSWVSDLMPEYQQNRQVHTVKFLDGDDMIPKYTLSINRFQLLIKNLFYSTFDPFFIKTLLSSLSSSHCFGIA